jgi:hypothetical protein
MRVLCTLAVVITGAALIAGVPLRDALACDDDRYPCPVRAQAQETADAPAQPAPSAQPKKKVSQPRANEKTNAKREREVARATARTKVTKPAGQEQAADPISQKATEAAPAAVVSSGADQSFNNETRGENLLATAGTAWPVFPNTEGAGGTPAATSVNPGEAAPNAAQLIGANEANELDRATAATGESSWVTYLLLILGAALAVAVAMWFFSEVRFLFARRAANPH